MAPESDARMAAGIASIAAHERAQRQSERLDAERAAGRPAPPEIANRPGRAERKAAESVRCPYCKAAPGHRCEGAHHRILAASHPSRVDAYAVQVVACPECHAGAGSACCRMDGSRLDGAHPARVKAVPVAGGVLGQQP